MSLLVAIAIGPLRLYLGYQGPLICARGGRPARFFSGLPVIRVIVALAGGLALLWGNVLRRN
jgi:hypothetical protein